MSEAAKMRGLEDETRNWVSSPPSGGAALVARYQDKDGTVSFERIADGFGMSKAQLAESIGLKLDTIYRAERLRGRPAQTRMREMLEVVSRVADWAGGAVQAFSWYRAEPIPAFGGRTAEALVKDGKANAVRDYLDHVATGGFA